MLQNGDVAFYAKSGVLNFHWVRVKDFFLAPEITVPDLICSTGIATMDVDTAATNITWQLTPSYLFTASSGTGTTANIVRIAGASGLGTVTYSFQMPSGEYFTGAKNFWVGVPEDSYLDLNANMAGNNLLMPGDDNQIVGRYDGPDCGTILDYNWGSWSGWNHFEVGTSNFISYFSVPYDFSTSEDIYVSAVNACGESPNHFKTFYPIQYFYFSIYPNPATDYIQLSIEPESEVTDKTSKVKIAKVKGKDGLGEYSIEIWSEKGGRLKTLTSKDMCQQISIPDLPTGKYFVHVIVDGKTYKQQLIVAK